MALMVAGTLFPPSYCASFLAARIAAIIPSTRFRPSSMWGVPRMEPHAKLREVDRSIASCSLFVRHHSENASSGCRLLSRVALGQARWVGHKGCCYLLNAPADPNPVRAAECPASASLSSSLLQSPVRDSTPVLVRNGRILTNKAKRRLRRDRQPVHCLWSAAAQLDRRSRSRSCPPSCRCLMRQQTLHRAPTLLPPSAS
jgi:hypothetical protein